MVWVMVMIVTFVQVLGGQVELMLFLFEHPKTLLQNQRVQLNMEQQGNNEEEDDVFETIMSENQDIKQTTFAAIRNSMMARGAEDGFVGHVWPLLQKIFVSSNIEEATQSQYGLQGILLKESPSFFGGWDQRYVILKRERFVYKETQSPISPNAGIINFNLLSCDVAIETKGGYIDNFRILIKNADKYFVFKGPDNNKTEEWYRAIVSAIKHSEGFNKNYTYLARYPRFWRKDYISETQFRRIAEPGDILLFRGKKDSSVMQRAITMDEYDHVAVVLLNQMGQPLIFQANGGFGVGICPWIKFIEKSWWAQYELIVHRRLNVHRSVTFLAVIQSFVGANMGKQYNFSLGDYIFQRNSSKQTDHQSYFCSSLVAKLYKRLDLLPADKSCKRYLPSSFAGKQNLQLCGDGKFGHAYLGVEKIVVFEQTIKRQ